MSVSLDVARSNGRVLPHDLGLMAKHAASYWALDVPDSAMVGLH